MLFRLAPCLVVVGLAFAQFGSAAEEFAINDVPQLEATPAAPSDAPEATYTLMDHLAAREGGYCSERGCDSKGGYRPACNLQHDFFVHGWIAQGFTWNPDNPVNRFNTPLTFNDRSNEYQLNQLYVSMGRAIDTSSCGWDFGGQVDLFFGTDYFFTQAIGLETRRDGSPRWNSSNGPRGTGAAIYGLAMPQLYAEVFAPIGGGISVKMGHFYTILGYESVPAPENFFYSHAYTMQYGEPFTHTGLLASYDLGPGLSIHGGLTRGWNTWEDPNDKLGFLGGVTWTSADECTSCSFAIHTGSEDNAGANNRTSYSLVVTQQLTCNLT
ncbi:MAG: outer membrane beta-barrel protein, partial [Thermoguttaceae bacterium]